MSAASTACQIGCSIGITVAVEGSTEPPAGTFLPAAYSQGTAAAHTIAATVPPGIAATAIGTGLPARNGTQRGKTSPQGRISPIVRVIPRNAADRIALGWCRCRLMDLHGVSLVGHRMIQYVTGIPSGLGGSVGGDDDSSTS